MRERKQAGVCVCARVYMCMSGRLGMCVRDMNVADRGSAWENCPSRRVFGVPRLVDDDDDDDGDENATVSWPCGLLLVFPVVAEQAVVFHSR